MCSVQAVDAHSALAPPLTTNKHHAQRGPHLVVQVHAEGDPRVEGGRGLVGGVDVGGAGRAQHARLVVQLPLDAAVAAGWVCGEQGEGA